MAHGINTGLPGGYGSAAGADRVARPRRQAPMQPPKALRMPETEETAEEFVGAELEMLAMGAKSIPPSSTLGAPRAA